MNFFSRPMTSHYLKVASYVQLQIIKPETVIQRSSHSEGFCKKVVLKNLAKFTGKPLCQSLFFNKVAA